MGNAAVGIVHRSVLKAWFESKSSPEQMWRVEEQCGGGYESTRREHKDSDDSSVNNSSVNSFVALASPSFLLTHFFFCERGLFHRGTRSHHECTKCCSNTLF